MPKTPYDRNVEKKLPKITHDPSGVPCPKGKRLAKKQRGETTVPECPGEMQVVLTDGKRQKHPAGELARAVCPECRTMGWV